MKTEAKHCMFYMEPKGRRAHHPIKDRYTICMLRAFLQYVSSRGTIMSSIRFEKGLYTMGYHYCGCGGTIYMKSVFEPEKPPVLRRNPNGPRSTGSDYQFPNEMVTNALCVHYLACHRPEVSKKDLQKVMNLKLDLNIDVDTPLNEQEEQMLQSMQNGANDPKFPHPDC